MGESLMGDARHNELIKAAEEVIGLSNIGVDGHAALRKIAEDNDMNDHEVKLVAHVVNNSKQLAHIQMADPDERENPFPLIDPDKVRENQPTTNADAETGDRYGDPPIPSSFAEQGDQPDAVDIQKELSKAAAGSYVETGDYRIRADAEDHADVFRQSLGLHTEKVASTELPQALPTNPFQILSHYRIGCEEARYKEAKAKLECGQVLDALDDGFRRIGAPSFERIEKIAAALDVCDDTLDLVWDHVQGEARGERRLQPNEKTAAERLEITAEERRLAGLCVRADTLWKEAANAQAAAIQLERECDRAEDGLMREKHAQAETGPKILLDPGSIGRAIGDAPSDYLPPSDVIEQALGDPGEQRQEFTERSLLPQSVRQDLKNVSSRAALERLMGDEYISGYSWPEVVDAYNSAMSVNPEFGRAELMSYVRQHLASQGAVPLDLQIRARGKAREEED